MFVLLIVEAFDVEFPRIVHLPARILVAVSVFYIPSRNVTHSGV